MQLEALLQLGMERLVGQRHDARRLGRGFSPHDRGAAALERQDRKRTGGQKMLLGASFVIALVRDIDDDGGLAVIPAVGGDARRSANTRARAVGSDEEAGAKFRSVGECCRHAVAVARECGDGGGLQRDANRPRFRRQGVDQQPVLDHVGERLARFDLAREGQEGRPHRVAKLAVGDDHVEDRLGVRRDGLPDTDGLEQTPRRRDDRRGALVFAAASAQRRIGNCYRERRSEPLPQGDGERQPGEAAAGNQDVNIAPCHALS